jgi:hypothetical protein
VRPASWRPTGARSDRCLEHLVLAQHHHRQHQGVLGEAARRGEPGAVRGRDAGAGERDDVELVVADRADLPEPDVTGGRGRKLGIRGHHRVDHGVDARVRDLVDDRPCRIDEAQVVAASDGGDGVATPRIPVRRVRAAEVEHAHRPASRPGRGLGHARQTAASRRASASARRLP